MLMNLAGHLDVVHLVAGHLAANLRTEHLHSQQHCRQIQIQNHCHDQLLDRAFVRERSVLEAT